MINKSSILNKCCLFELSMYQTSSRLHVFYKNIKLYTCFCQGWGNGWGEDPNAGGKTSTFNNNDKQNKTNKQTNKNYPVGEKLTGLDWTGLDWTGLDWTGLDWTGLDWTGLDWTGLDWTQDIDDPTYGNEPTRNCKHKIIKGANDEGNEGKQLGKINQ